MIPISPNPADDGTAGGKFCRICRRALNLYLDPTGHGSTRWIHGAPPRGERFDHSPDPVARSEITDPITVCDFCSTESPPYVYWCDDQTSDVNRVTGTYVRHSDYRSQHYAARAVRVDTEHVMSHRWGESWSACEVCAVQIDKRDLYALITRAVESLPARLTRGRRMLDRRGELHAHYSTFFETLQPGRWRVTPEHPLGTPEPPTAS